MIRCHVPCNYNLQYESITSLYQDIRTIGSSAQSIYHCLTLKCNIKSPQHYLIVFKPKYYYIGVIWGRKTNVF